MAKTLIDKPLSCRQLVKTGANLSHLSHTTLAGRFKFRDLEGLWLLVQRLHRRGRAVLTTMHA
jgi:hypothetical protein